MAVIEVLLRAVAALLLVDPASGTVSTLALAGLGLAAVSAAVLVAQVLALVLGVPFRTGTTARERHEDVGTRIGWSHPDADGHARPRAPGVVAAT